MGTNIDAQNDIGREFLRQIKDYCELTGAPIYASMEFFQAKLFEINNPARAGECRNIADDLIKKEYLDRIPGELLDKPISFLGITQKGLEYLATTPN